MTRRFAAFGLVLALIVSFVLGSSASSEPVDGVRVPSVEAFNALDARVTADEQALADLAARVAAFEATSEPTPTPNANPTEEPSPTPEPEPVPTGDFPTRSSVGPAVAPTEHLGDCYFDASQSGQVIDGKVIDCDSAGGVRFASGVTGVVFRNSIIRGQMFTQGNTPGDAGADTFPREPVFTVEDSKIIQSTTVDWQDRAACCSHYVIRRSLIQGTHSGIGAHNNVTLVGNFITTDGTDSHSSGVRVLKNAVLRGNTITCKPVTPGSDGGCSAAGVFYSEAINGTSAAAYNLTIEGNYFRRGVTASGEPGGAWNATRFINCKNRTDCVNISFTGNQFDTGWQTDGNEFPAAYGGNAWADNIWVDGQPALSGQSR